MLKIHAPDRDNGGPTPIEIKFIGSAPIHKQLLDALDPSAGRKIGQVLASNLARTDPQELPGHFAKAASQNPDESGSA